MPFPLLPLLVGGGLIGGENYFRNNADESNSFIDTAFGIDRSAQREAQRIGNQAANLAQGIPVGQRATGNPQFDALQTAAATGDASFIDQQIGINARQQAAALKQQQDETVRLEQKRLAGTIREEDLARADRTQLVGMFQRELGGFAEQQQNFQGLKASLESGTAQDALTATIGIMKTLDPTSVVRQEEGQAVVQAEGAMAGFANTLNKIAGRGWNPTTRQEWFDAVRRIYAPAQQRASRQMQFYEDEARRRRVDPASLGGLGIDREFKANTEPFKGQGGALTPEELKEQFGLTVIGEI